MTPPCGVPAGPHQTAGPIEEMKKIAEIGKLQQLIARSRQPLAGLPRQALDGLRLEAAFQMHVNLGLGKRAQMRRCRHSKDPIIRYGHTKATADGLSPRSGPGTDRSRITAGQLTVAPWSKIARVEFRETAAPCCRGSVAHQSTGARSPSRHPRSRTPFDPGPSRAGRRTRRRGYGR